MKFFNLNMMRKLDRPFGSNYSCEPMLNNFSFAHLDTDIFVQSFLTKLLQFALTEWGKGKVDMKLSRPHLSEDLGSVLPLAVH